VFARSVAFAIVYFPIVLLLSAEHFFQTKMIQIIPEIADYINVFAALYYSLCFFIRLWLQICLASLAVIFTIVLTAFAYDMWYHFYYSIHYTANPKVAVAPSFPSFAFPVLSFPSFPSIPSLTYSMQDFLSEISFNQSHCSSPCRITFIQSIILSILKTATQSKSKPKMPDFFILEDPCSTRMVAEAKKREKILEQRYKAHQQKLYDNSPMVIAKKAIFSAMGNFVPSFGFVRVFLNSKPQIDGLFALASRSIHSFSTLKTNKSSLVTIDKGKGKAVLDIPEWPFYADVIPMPKETAFIATKKTKVLAEQPNVAPIAPKVRAQDASVKIEPVKEYPNADNVLDHLPQILASPLRFSESAFDSATRIAASGIKFVFRI
jgi:hypothetical protein